MVIIDVYKRQDQLDKGSQKATKSIKNMGQGMLQVAYFMDDVQYGIKGCLLYTSLGGSPVVEHKLRNCYR